jgi:hypothetical protein
MRHESIMYGSRVDCSNEGGSGVNQAPDLAPIPTIPIRNASILIMARKRLVLNLS